MVFVASSYQAAFAAPRQLAEAIHVNRGATCIDEAALREQVRARLGSDTLDGDLRVAVDGSSSDETFVSFRIWQRERLIAERSFSPGPSQCAQMHAVVAVAIALALKVSLRDEDLAEPARSPTGRWSVGAATIFSWSVVPGVAGGALVWVERSFGEHFAAHLGLSGLLGAGTTFERVAGEFVSSSVAGEIAACGMPSLGRGIRVRVCTGLEGRALFASGSGFATSKETSVQWFSLVTSLGVSGAITAEWALIGALGVAVPLQKVQIVVEDPGGQVVETRDSTAVGGLLSFGAAYAF
jgi:hypothetical protein